MIRWLTDPARQLFWIVHSTRATYLACPLGRVPIWWATALLTAILLSAPARAQVAVGDAVFPATGLTTTLVQVKAARGNIDGLICVNPNAAIEYVQAFDSATTTGITLGTTAPKVFFPWSASGAQSLLAPANGIFFTNGIVIAATTTATGSTAPSSALNCNVVFR